MKPGFLRRYAASIAALVVVLALFLATQYPKLSPAESSELAARFHFSKAPLPEVHDHPPYKNVREVHPSLQRISAWISSLGAAAAFADLDGDGLPNDLIYVDPRTDLVTVRSEEHTSELQSQSNLVCRLLLEKKKNKHS